MILCLLFFYLFGGSMASNNTTAGSSFSSKSIMCVFKGKMLESDTSLINLDPKDIPSECEAIIYKRFEINTLGIINSDEVLLQSVRDLNKPVIVSITRTRGYNDWIQILGDKGNDVQIKALCDFAIKNKISGYLLGDITPENYYTQIDEKVAKGIIPFIKQLKCNPDFIIGIGVDPYGSSIKNPGVYNFEELNALVDFYEIKTYALNDCQPTKYNDITPIPKVDHGSNYIFGMEEVASFLNESKICLTKITYGIGIRPININIVSYYSYGQVCEEKEFNPLHWCVQTSKNFYDKGTFALQQGSGIIVKFLDLDDIKNVCSCSTEFNGFKNIIAGFCGGSLIPCEKFDVKASQ